METTEFRVDTSGRRICEITDRVVAFAREHGGSGVVHVFLPHATAGLALLETGAGSEGDLEEALERLLPRDDRYAHRHGDVGHGADHLLPALLPPSLVLPVDDGGVVLGTWQSIVLVDTNRQNNQRRVRLTLLRSA